jgi:hypothetical protein
METDPAHPSRLLRIASACAVAAALGWWLVLAVRQVADGGFYSDDYGIQWDWNRFPYWESVEVQAQVMGAKPLLAFLLPTSYEVLGTDPAGHQALAAVLALASAGAFYLVLRALRFEPRDAVPVALLALLFPWVSSVRLWPTGSLNNFAVLLLFAGILVALRTLPPPAGDASPDASRRTTGARGLLLHLPATALYAAAVLTYDATAAVAAGAWLLYARIGGWRATWPRALMDVVAVGAAAIWTREHTNKYIAGLADQIAHVPDIARGGAELIAASLVPAAVPIEMQAALTVAVLAIAGALIAAAALRGGSRWPLVAAASVAALALCWAIYIPQAFYTPTFRGIEDRVNIVAVYPAALLVWSVLRGAGSLLPRGGYALAAAGAAAIAIAYGVHDTRQQSDWAEAAALQEPVLEAVERAEAPDGTLVLTFGHPAETAPGVPVFNASWDLHPAAQVLTGADIHTYPVFEGAELKCARDSFTVQRLPTPLYEVILIAQRGTPRTFPYGAVIFVDAASGRTEVIRSREECERALRLFRPGPHRGTELVG